MDALTQALINRDGEWEAYAGKAREHADQLIGVIADANRCAAESAGRSR